MPVLSLTKHHGLGNDFLVLLDLEGVHPLDAATARALCDRHIGVGADGVIRATAGTDGAALTFELRNADGSPAEMSGNGIRCLAQAAVDAGVVTGPSFTVATPAGVRCLTISQESAAGLRTASVEMGLAKVETVDGQTTVDMGNPHLVIRVNSVEDLTSVTTPDPTVNVEFVAVGPGVDTITMRVFERGVGETMACGTGACAAAAAARDWGVAGQNITVHQPGGPVEVKFTTGTIVLTGPTQRVARVEVEIA